MKKIPLLFGLLSLGLVLSAWTIRAEEGAGSGGAADKKEVKSDDGKKKADAETKKMEKDADEAKKKADEEAKKQNKEAKKKDDGGSKKAEKHSRKEEKPAPSSTRSWDVPGDPASGAAW